MNNGRISLLHLRAQSNARTRRPKRYRMLTLVDIPLLVAVVAFVSMLVWIAVGT